MTLFTVFVVCWTHSANAQCADPTETETITGIIYADNWFRFWFNGDFIMEDPIVFIPHQAVEVSFEAPLCGEFTFAIQAQDFSDDTTALEYDDNCIGDGGLKAMFSDGTVTNGDWVCKTIMYGPVDPETCIPDFDPDYHFTPPLCKGNEDESLKGRDCTALYSDYADNWYEPDFDADGDGWEDVVTFTDEVVGYGVSPEDCSVVICPAEVDWATYGDEAEFIWRDDLNFDNRVLCRYTYDRGDCCSTSDSGSDSGSDSDSDSGDAALAAQSIMDEHEAGLAGGESHRTIAVKINFPVNAMWAFAAVLLVSGGCLFAFHLLCGQRKT